MALNPRLKNEYARLKQMVNPNHVTIDEIPNPEQQGMALILRFSVRGIRSMGTTSLNKEPSPVDRYCFYVNIPKNFPYSSIRIKFDKFNPNDGHEKVMLPYVPNVFADGSWCYGGWTPDCQLHLIVRRLLRALVFDPHPQVMNFGSPANYCTESWFKENQKSFPYFPPELLFSAPRTAASSSPPPPVIRK